MNLEAIEQKCLAYLMQVSRPVVPVEQLLRYLRREEEFATVSERELLDFLRKHELFKLLDPIGLVADAEGAKAMAEAGISIGPCVILETRIPTDAQMVHQMELQLEILVQSLQTAAAEAREKDDRKRLKVLEGMLSRAEAIRERLKSLD